MLNRMDVRNVSTAINIGCVHLGLTDQSENSKQEMQWVHGGPQRDQETPTKLLRPVIAAAVEAVLSLDRMVYMTFAAHAPSIAQCNRLKSWESVTYLAHFSSGFDLRERAFSLEEDGLL